MSLQVLHNIVKEGFTTLPDNAREYLVSRKLDYGYLASLGCGFLGNGINLAKMLQSDKELKKFCMGIGFITPHEHMLTDAFYFPIYNNLGEITTFSIKLLPWSSFVQRGGSTHWTMKTPIGFPIGSYYPVVGNDPFRGKATFVCEGASDTITLLQNGYRAIGLVGISNWRDSYIDFLNTKAVIIAFDRDQNLSGQRASVKLARKLANAGMSEKVFILELPMGHDVNSFYDDSFFQYSKTHLHKFLQTKAGKAWKNTHDNPPVKNRNRYNQMTEKINNAKAKDIVSVYLSLFCGAWMGKSSRGFRTRCPFHDDQKASLHLYTDTNSFFCFGCQASGDTITLVRKCNPGWEFNREVLGYINNIQ